MKIRSDAVAVSSVLFTLALLIPAPAMLMNAWTVPQRTFDIARRMGEGNYYAPIGFASLAIIIIGLIVTWAGYFKGVCWTWIVMFLITWGWVFPALVLAGFHWRNMLPMAQWPSVTPRVGGPQLGFREPLLMLFLMVLALALPARTFVSGRGWELKIRWDALALSSTLFTLSLLLLTPAVLASARSTYLTRYADITDYPEAGIPLDQVVVPNYDAPLGITSLAIIVVGLLVTWAGYSQGVRWTWFVMFVIVWVWAFQVVVLPLFRLWQGVDAIPQRFTWAIHEVMHAGPYSGIARVFLQDNLIFLLMLLALALPVRTFFGQRLGATNQDK